MQAIAIHDAAPATFQKNSLNALLLAYCNLKYHNYIIKWYIVKISLYLYLINVKYNMYDAKNHIN